MNNAVSFNIPLLAKIVGRQSGIQVVFSDRATTASFNLRTKVCTLPNAMIYSGKEKDATIIRGFIVHEAVGHGRHTDLKVWETIKTPFQASLCNILEDIRIEKAAWQCYPGAKGMLHELVEEFVADKDMDFFGQHLTEEKLLEAPPVMILEGLLLSYLRKTCLKQPLEFDKFEKVAELFFGAELVGKIKDVAIKSDQATSTADCLALTNEIIALLQQAAEDQPPPQSEDNDSDGADGQGEAESDSGDSDDDAEGNPSDSQDSDSNGKPSKSKKSGKSKGKSDKSEESDQGKGGSEKSEGKPENGSPDDTSSPEASDKPSDDKSQDKSSGKPGGEPEQDAGEPQGQPQSEAGKPNDVQANAKSVLEQAEERKTGLEDMVAQMVEKIVEAAAEAAKQDPYGYSHKSSRGTLDSVVRVIKATPNYDESSNMRFNRANSVKLSSRLEDLLEAKVETSEEFGNKGMLASRKLSKIKLLDTRVFSLENSETEGLDTSLFMLGDMSGSMDGENAISFMDATLSLATSLDKNEVPFGISYFNGHITEVKSFHERFSKVKGRVQQYYKTGGGTPIFESMIYAAMKATQTTNKRKILLVVTDGTFSSTDLDIAAFRETLSKFQSDLEVRFVLIGTQMEATYQYLVANKIKVGKAESSDKICKAMFDALENVF